MDETEQFPLWNFDKIAEQDIRRADELRNAPSYLEIIEMVSKALRAAIASDNLLIGIEAADKCPTDFRVVVQFHVGLQLWDWFFNAQTGYRGQYKKNSVHGHYQNQVLFNLLRLEFESVTGRIFPASCIGERFEYKGPTSVSVPFILSSLDPILSKAWCCTGRVYRHGVTSSLRVGHFNRGLSFNVGDDWSALYVDEEDAWLDLKGAFLRLYQEKDPMKRAEEMWRTGSA